MKTQWVDANPSQGILGSLVTAAWLRLSGNHRHTGIDEDGNCPLDYYTAGGTANALTVTCNPTLTAHIPGMPIYIKITSTNTGAVTLKVDALAPVALNKGGGIDLAPGDLPGGSIIAVAYDGADYELLSGFTRFATTDQARSMSNSAVSLSPALLGQVIGSISGQVAENGYMLLPGLVLVNGQYRQLILQWGVGANAVGGAGAQTITFPLTFPNAFLRAVVGAAGAAGYAYSGAGYLFVSATTSQMVVYRSTADASVGQTPIYLAIGC